MFKVIVHSTAIAERSGTSQRTGKDFYIREQSAFVFLNNEPYPQKITLNLNRDQAPYPKGEYTLTPEFFVGNFGDLRVGMRQARLEPVADSKPKAVNS